MTARLQVPAELQRNSPAVAADGYEDTGLHLLALAAERLGVPSLAGLDVLDIGCGVRFAQTIVNRRVPIGSYTGLEVHRPIVDFLRADLEAVDPRFRFAHWDVRNALFNPDSPRPLTAEHALPVDAQYDAIWLFSVFTHLDLDDARAMLRLTRQAIRPGGALLFTAFVDPALDGVESRHPAHPLQMVFYGHATLVRLIEDTGWRSRAFYAGGPKPFVQPCFRCAPA